MARGDRFESRRIIQQQQDGLVIIRMGIHNNTPATLCACTSFSRQQQRVE